MIKLVVWDWNGTLFADTEACIDAGNHIIRTFGGTPLPRKQYVSTFDFPTVEFYCKQGCNREALLLPDSGEIFHDFYEQRAAKCGTRRGARNVLQHLKDNSIDSIILSNHTQKAIAVQLSRLNLNGYISEVLANTTSSATHVGNNKIGRISLYLSRTRHNHAQAVIVGDSPEDVGIGKKLGMGTIAITDGSFSTPRLRACNPDYIISNLREVIGIVNNY